MSRLNVKEVRDIVNEELTKELLVMEEKVSKLENKVLEQDNRLEVVDSHLKELEYKVNVLESGKILQGIVNDHLVRCIDDQNQYQRRQNIIIDGLFIPKNSGDKEIRQIVIAHFKKMKINVFDSEVVRAHRTGKPYRDTNGKFHVPILCRFVSWLPRNEVYENRRKGLGVRFKPDLTDMRQETFDSLCARLEEDERAKKLVSYIFIDRNCRLSAKTVDERVMAINSVQEFDLLLNFIENTLPPYDVIFKLLHDQKVLQFQKVDNLVNLHTIENVQEFLEREDTKYIGRKSACFEVAESL